MKTDVLFKEYPWIKSLHPLISQAIHFRVTRLDTQELAYRQVGHYRTGGISCNSFGFFMTHDGMCIGKIHQEEKQSLFDKFLEFLWGDTDSRTDTARTIERAASELHRNQILSVSYIVIVDQMMHDREIVTIDFIKIPNETDLYEMLRKVSDDREMLKINW